MITLNLIPPKDKQELRLLNVFLAVKNILLLSLIGTVAVASGLIATRLFLQNYFQYLVASNTLVADAGRASNAEMRTITDELADAQRIQRAYVPWSRFLIDLGDRVNAGIIISDLSVNANGQGEISGVAKTRDDLLAFHDQLVQSGLTDDFTVPLAIKFQEKDVKFRFAVQWRIPRLPEPTL